MFRKVTVDRPTSAGHEEGQTSEVVQVDVGDGVYVSVYLHMTGKEADPYYLVIEVDNDEDASPALKVVRNDQDVYEEGID